MLIKIGIVLICLIASYIHLKLLNKLWYKVLFSIFVVIITAMFLQDVSTGENHLTLWYSWCIFISIWWCVTILQEIDKLPTKQEKDEKERRICLFGIDKLGNEYYHKRIEVEDYRDDPDYEQNNRPES